MVDDSIRPKTKLDWPYDDTSHHEIHIGKRFGPGYTYIKCNYFIWNSPLLVGIWSREHPTWLTILTRFIFQRFHTDIYYQQQDYLMYGGIRLLFHPFTLRAPLESVVCNSNTFGNNLGKKHRFAKYLKESYCLASD